MKAVGVCKTNNCSKIESHERKLATVVRSTTSKNVAITFVCKNA